MTTQEIVQILNSYLDQFADEDVLFCGENPGSLVFMYAFNPSHQPCSGIDNCVEVENMQQYYDVLVQLGATDPNLMEVVSNELTEKGIEITGKFYLRPGPQQ